MSKKFHQFGANDTVLTDFCAVGGQTPNVDQNGVADLSPLFSPDNSNLASAVSSVLSVMCVSLDPTTSSIKDIINCLKGSN